MAYLAKVLLRHDEQRKYGYCIQAMPNGESSLISTFNKISQWDCARIRLKIGVVVYVCVFVSIWLSVWVTVSVRGSGRTRELKVNGKVEQQIEKDRNTLKHLYIRNSTLDDPQLSRVKCTHTHIYSCVECVCVRVYLKYTAYNDNNKWTAFNR